MPPLHLLSSPTHNLAANGLLCSLVSACRGLIGALHCIHKRYCEQVSNFPALLRLLSSSEEQQTSDS